MKKQTKNQIASKRSDKMKSDCTLKFAHTTFTSCLSLACCWCVLITLKCSNLICINTPLHIINFLFLFLTMDFSYSKDVRSQINKQKTIKYVIKLLGVYFCLHIITPSSINLRNIKNIRNIKEWKNIFHTNNIPFFPKQLNLCT